jgi:hypothetical protein
MGLMSSPNFRQFLGFIPDVLAFLDKMPLPPETLPPKLSEGGDLAFAGSGIEPQGERINESHTKQGFHVD